MSMTTRWIGDCFGLVGQVLDGKYRIDGVVAEGGFAVVYRGAHQMLNRAVAVKVLKTHTHTRDNDVARQIFIDGFVREAQTIVRLNHPNIVQVLDFGVTVMPSGERAPWMALEWLEGRTLRAELQARRGRGGRSPEEAVTFLRPIIEALAYAHDEGVAHRDVKPANIMLVDGRRGTTLKLLDFGIAKVMPEGDEPGSGHTLTSSDMHSFSLNYAAPEQISATRTGPWTDVHALGLILTELLTDQPPLQGRDRTEVLADILASARPTPARRGVDVGPLEPVIARALALRPSDRYRNAGELLSALDAALVALKEKSPASLHGSAPAAIRGSLAEAPRSVPESVADTAISALQSTTQLQRDIVRPAWRGPWVLTAAALAFLALGVVIAWKWISSAVLSGPVPRNGSQQVIPSTPVPASLSFPDRVPPRDSAWSNASSLDSGTMVSHPLSSSRDRVRAGMRTDRPTPRRTDPTTTIEVE